MRCNAPRNRKRQARTTWSNAGRPGSKALFMESRDNGLPLLHAPRVYLDIAAGRNSASRIVPCRNLGPRRARSARFFHGARQYRSVARGMPPRRRRQRRKTWGGVGRPGNKALLMEKRETDCELGTLRWHHRASQRGATMRASSSHTTSPERDVRGARNAAWPTARSQRRARQHPATSRAIGEQDLGATADGRKSRRCSW